MPDRVLLQMTRWSDNVSDNTAISTSLITGAIDTTITCRRTMSRNAMMVFLGSPHTSTRSGVNSDWYSCGYQVHPSIPTYMPGLQASETAAELASHSDVGLT